MTAGHATRPVGTGRGLSAIGARPTPGRRRRHQHQHQHAHKSPALALCQLAGDFQLVSTQPACLSMYRVAPPVPPTAPACTQAALALAPYSAVDSEPSSSREVPRQGTSYSVLIACQLRGSVQSLEFRHTPSCRGRVRAVTWAGLRE